MLRSWLIAPIINLLQRIAMNQADLAAALSAVSTSLEGVGTQLSKATAEIVAAIAAGNGTTPEVDAAVAKLEAVSTALKTASQALDDLNPDAP